MTDIVYGSFTKKANNLIPKAFDSRFSEHIIGDKGACYPQASGLQTPPTREKQRLIPKALHTRKPNIALTLFPIYVRIALVKHLHSCY